MADSDVTLALDNHPPAAPDATRYAHEFAYSLLPLFASFNILDDLPLGGATASYAALSWTAVTEYRFVLLQLTNDAQEASGQLYILGSVHPDGAATKTPNATGGELMQKRNVGDAMFYLSRYLLIRQLFLKNVAQTFKQRLANGSYDQATTDNFTVTNGGSITNTDKIYLPYALIKRIISTENQTIVEGAFRSDLAESVQVTASDAWTVYKLIYGGNSAQPAPRSMEDVVFEVEARAFSFDIGDGTLVMSFKQISSGDKVRLNDVSVKLEYEFSQRDGLSRYTATDEQTIGSIELNLGSTWNYALRYGAWGLTGVIVLGTVVMAGYQFRQAAADSRTLVPAAAQGGPIVEPALEQMLAYLRNRGGGVGRREEVAINPPAPAADDSQVNLVPLEPERPTQTVRRNLLRCLRRSNQVSPASRNMDPAEQLVKSYSAKLDKYLGGKSHKEYDIFICQRKELKDAGLQYDHTYSLGLKSITKQGNKLHLVLRLDDTPYL